MRLRNVDDDHDDAQEGASRVAPENPMYPNGCFESRETHGDQEAGYGLESVGGAAAYGPHGAWEDFHR